MYTNNQNTIHGNIDRFNSTIGIEIALKHFSHYGMFDK